MDVVATGGNGRWPAKADHPGKAGAPMPEGIDDAIAKRLAALRRRRGPDKL